MQNFQLHRDVSCYDFDFHLNLIDSLITTDYIYQIDVILQIYEDKDPDWQRSSP